MNDVINQLIGFLVGLLSSFAFWYFLLRLKPHVAISPVVVFDPDESRSYIKIFNKTRRQVSDIQVTLTVSELQSRKDQFYIVNLYSVNLKKDSLFALGGRQNYGKPWTLYPTFTFVTEDDKNLISLLSSEVGNEKRLVFTLTASDALSGTKVTQRVSYSLKDIRIGNFELGLHFQVAEIDGKRSIKDVKSTT